MINEEWWDDAKYWFKSPVDGMHEPDLEKIVAEATRKGEAKAWAEALQFHLNSLESAYNKFRELPMPAFAELKKTDYAQGYGLGWEMAVNAFMGWCRPISLSDHDAKLKSLT